MWASKEGGSGPGDKQHGGERGHSCLFLEDPPSVPFLFLGPVLWIEYILLLSSPFKATSNCSLVLALCQRRVAVFMISSACWGVHLPKLFCYWRCSCSFCQTDSWALITKMWANCREAARVGLDPTGGTEGHSWPSLGLKRSEETGTWGESWV